jgi:hypothetical protein
MYKSITNRKMLSHNEIYSFFNEDGYIIEVETTAQQINIEDESGSIEKVEELTYGQANSNEGTNAENEKYGTGCDVIYHSDGNSLNLPY